MGTRSLTYVYREFEGDDPNSDKPLVCMYRQFDGYREGHGLELAEFLKPIQLINGIPVGATPGNGVRWANGMGCLAAQMIAHFKKDVGGFYLNTPDPIANAEGWQEYEYHVYPDRVEVSTGGAKPELLFTGTWREFYNWCVAEEPKEEVLDEEVSLPINDLPVALQKGIVTVSFIKSDGSKRTMRCTTNPDYFPVLPANTSTSLKSDPNLFKVWDVEAKGWRSFRKERIISITQ